MSASTGELRFGTAGLRGKLGDGPGEVNRSLLRRVGTGLAHYLESARAGIPEAWPGPPRVVVGFDARHGSAAFAQEAAGALAGSGISAQLLPGPLPTPVLAFAVRELECAAGIMITASHNPADENGCKVYGADGVQVLPDQADEIADAIAGVDGVEELALGGPQKLDDSIIERYVEAIVEATAAAASPGTTPKIVYTPIHGVGHDTLQRAFRRAGLVPPHVVECQREPDPDFPTAPRPNPEDPAVLAPAIEEARRHDADVVLANDPDADRLAVAVPWSEAPDGWRALTGDEIGSLLADRLLTGAIDPNTLVVTTIVSSSLLSRIARARGAHYAETLTGFKWIMHAAQHPDRRFRFGYEEALGFAVTDRVGDKDGISAALMAATLVAEYRRRGTTVQGRLDELAAEFGVHATAQRTLELSSETAETQIADAFATVRAHTPRSLAGEPVTAIDDLERGRRVACGGATEPLNLPSARVLVLRSSDRVRVAVRPSGTEPKLKVYLEVVRDIGTEGVDTARRVAAQRLEAVADEILAVIAS